MKGNRLSTSLIDDIECKIIEINNILDNKERYKEKYLDERKAVKEELEDLLEHYKNQL